MVKNIDIPEEVLDVLKIWRPAPLVRARNLEQALGTKSKIYFKNEGVSPVGSHKPNSAVPQAYYNAKEGIKRLATETGAGQWGSALSFATQKFGLECMVYMLSILGLVDLISTEVHLTNKVYPNLPQFELLVSDNLEHYRVGSIIKGT